MKYASICDGIGAVHCAWQPLGWRCAWTSEIEPFPSSVVEQRWGFKNRGDFTKIQDSEPIDLLVGGTPCQDFSVAGLRAGLAGERGNLTLEFVALAGRLRPEWLVWENVPGVLSLDRGEAFRIFLHRLAQCGYGFAYRVLDAQYFGVPQRRRRVFLVGHSSGQWQRAAAVLFERESLRRDITPRREAGKGISHDLAPSLDESGCGFSRTGDIRWQDPVIAVAPTLGAEFGQKQGLDNQHIDSGGGISLSLHAKAQRLDPTFETLIPIGGGFDAIAIRTAQTSSNGHGIGEDGQAYTLDGTQGQCVAHSLKADGFDVSEDGTGRGTPLVQANFHGASYTLRSTPSHSGDKGDDGINTTLVASNLTSNGDAHSGFRDDAGLVQHRVGVRRLTPLECERLQGFTTCIERVIIDACLDHQSSVARVDVKCLRSQSSALPVERGASTALALSADTTLWNDRESQDSLVAVHVRQSHEPMVRVIRNRGKYIWCANGANDQNWFHQYMPHAAFARAIAALVRSADQILQIGRAESPASIKRFTLPANGRWCAAIFGRESAESVSDAALKLIVDTKYIMSNLGQNAPDADLIKQIWPSFALGVISLCIPSGTQTKNSCRLIVDLESDYTAITVRKKPAADGPRYKALGNSMAVPVMNWIGKRIKPTFPA